MPSGVRTGGLGVAVPTRLVSFVLTEGMTGFVPTNTIDLLPPVLTRGTA